MILQAGMSTLMLWTFIVGIIVSIIVFIIGVLITRWWAGKKGWSEELKTALILNIFWLVINIVLGWLLWGIIALIINIVVGGWLAAKLYEKELKDGIIFVIVVLIILFVIFIILVIILSIIIVAAVVGAAYAM
ncbi:MAG: hypothetical protein EU529_06810 [Promethearchaeota archaeon]|nr:MAG: hypothetical protein EU529_06810 [Candidatus Lokiarchaeota archaeon]